MTMRTTAIALMILTLLGAGAGAQQGPSPRPVQPAAPQMDNRGDFEMVLVHELGSNAAVWDDITPYLSGLFDVQAFEISGHGHTPPTDNVTVEAEAARLGEFLDATDVVYPTLVGHGIGGMIALRYALDNPARVHRLILMDSTPRSLADADQRTDTALKLAQDYDRTVAIRYLNMTPMEDVGEQIVDTALRTDSASFITLLMSTNDFDVTEELKGLSMPLLVVGSEMMFPYGTDSRELLHAVGFGLARSLSFKRIGGTGHFMQLENPRYLASILTAFGVTAEYQFEN